MELSHQPQFFNKVVQTLRGRGIRENLKGNDRNGVGYKNGASSREDFAVPYKKKNGNDSLFYVDIVIQFNNGTLGLFDPKTIESDPENINKHNALIEFIEKRNEKNNATIGGIILPKQGSWRFCRNRIANDSDLTGWDIFNPASITAKETA